jgi:hypothetical protein
MDATLLLPDTTAHPNRPIGVAEVEEIVARIAAVPFVDPGQVPMYQQARLDSGERRLALAILDDAVRCALRHSSSPVQRQRAEADDALRWIASDESSYALSFVPICQALGIDADWIRRLVRRSLCTSGPARRETAAHGAMEGLEREVA